MKKNVRKFNRSGIAICPICKLQTKLVQHHINGRKIDRYDEPFNTVWICPTCHDQFHSGSFDIKGWIQTSSGRELLVEKRFAPTDNHSIGANQHHWKDAFTQPN